MAEWIEKRLDEIVEFNPRDTIKKGVIAKKIAMDKLQPFCRDITGFELEPFSSGTKFRNGDTIMARITPCLENGKTAKVNTLDDGEVGFGSTEYIVFRVREGIDADFVYYLVVSPIVREPAIKSMVGSSGRQRVQIDVVQSITVMVPALEEQKAIAGVLKSLDDKIAINKKINNNLEQQAQLLFDQWFGCHFGKPTIPTGWLLKNLGDTDVLITDYVANGSFKSLAENVQYLTEETDNVLIRLTDYNNNYSSDMVYISDSAYEFLEKSKLLGDEIIISNVGANVGTVFRCPRLNKRMSLAPNAVLLRSELYEHYLYMLFTSTYGQYLLQSIVTGSAQPKFNKTNFRSLKVLIPDKETLSLFNNVYTPIYEQIALNNMENAQLSNLRDALLPKLMSGEIDMSNLRI